MFHDSSQRLLNKQESTLSFHANPLDTNSDNILKNAKVLATIYVICQLLQLIIGFEIVATSHIIPLCTQRCVVLIIVALGYIHFGDQQLYQLDQDCTRMIIGLSVLQVMASLAGFVALKEFQFSEACTFYQLTPGYILVLAHVLIQPGYQIILYVVLFQTASTVLFSGGFIFILIGLLHPISLAMMNMMKHVLAKQVPQLTLILYTNLLGLPVLILLSIVSKEVDTLFDLSQLLYVIVMSVFQLLAILAMNEMVQSQISQLQIWALSGIVVILSIIVQLIMGTPLGFGTLSVIFIVFTSIAIHK